MASGKVAALCSPSSPARRRFKPVQDAAAREKLRRTDAWWTTFLVRGHRRRRRRAVHRHRPAAKTRRLGLNRPRPQLVSVVIISVGWCDGFRARGARRSPCGLIPRCMPPRSPGFAARSWPGRAPTTARSSRSPMCCARSATTNECTNTDPSRRSSNRASDSTPHTSPNRGAPITAALLRSAVSSVRYSATDSRAGTNACRDSDRGGGDRDGSGAGPDPGLRQRGGAPREGGPGSPTPPGSVTSILGHDLLSGIVRRLGLAFLLLHVGQLLYWSACARLLAASLRVA